jgi:hypothetical protein
LEVDIQAANLLFEDLRRTEQDFDRSGDIENLLNWNKERYETLYLGNGTSGSYLPKLNSTGSGVTCSDKNFNPSNGTVAAGYTPSLQTRNLKVRSVDPSSKSSVD